MIVVFCFDLGFSGDPHNSCNFFLQVQEMVVELVIRVLLGGSYFGKNSLS